MYKARFLGIQGSTRRLFGPVLEYVARDHLEAQVADPALRAKLLPD